MIPNAAHIVVTPADYPLHLAHAVRVHHRDFPEVRGEGGSAQDAAGRLIALLSRTLDDAPSDWRRENLEHAIEDVRAFASLDIERGAP